MRITEITMMTFELLPSLFPPKTNYDDDSNQIPLPSGATKYVHVNIAVAYVSCKAVEA